MSALATPASALPVPTFGGFTLDELSRRAGMAARYEAWGVEALEVLSAREPGLERCVLAIEQGARELAVIRALLLALGPHAATVHALIGTEAGR